MDEDSTSYIKALFLIIENYLQILIYLAGFIIIAVASNQISRFFLRAKLPLVTGLLVMGIIA